MIVVTGGAGFIGSNLLASLEGQGARELVCVDNFGAGDKWKNVAKRLLADVLPPADLPAFLAARKGRIETIFHMGANSATTETDVDSIVRTNIRASLDLWDWCAANGAAFVYASSAATYGDGAQGMDDQSDELARLRPLNMYGYSKHLFDLYAQRSGWLSRIVGVKYFNVFGPNEDHKADMRSLVNKAYQQILATGKVQLFKSHKPEYKDGEQKRDFLYVKDAVEMTLHFADDPKGRQTGGLFNLGSGEANTWLTLTHAIFAALGRPPQIEFIAMPEVLQGKYQYFTQADVTKLRASGYARAMTPLAEAVRDYVQGYLVPDRKLGE